MKRILLITICLLFAAAALAQSNTDKVRQFERLLREWKSDGYSTGSEKYTQLMSMVTEGCRMSDYVAKSYIDDNNASTFNIKAGSWFQYIKEKKIIITLRDLREKTGDDGRRIVYCWIKYTQPGKHDREDFVGFKFDGGRIIYICNDDMELANRIKMDSETNVVDTKPTVPFTITSCTVSNEDYDGNQLPMDAEHSQYLTPTITYYCTTSGSYDIYVKLYDANGSLSTGNSSPSGYSQVNSGVSLSSGSGIKKLKGWGGTDSGHWRAGNYRYEFYYDGTLLYTYRFSVPERTASDGSQPYAVFSYGILTFYYGKNKPVGAYGMRTTVDNEWGVVKEQIKKVVFDQSFKNFRPKSCSCWFHKCKNLVSIEGIRDYLNTSEVTDMSFMFDNDSCLTSLDVSGFNTEKVTNMRAMFQSCGKLTSLDVSHFNTANVTDMSFMFRDCENLTSLDISHFNTAKATTMCNMFYNCHNLTRLDVSGFNTDNVTDMEGMFWSCKKISYLDVRGFNTTNVTNIRSLFCSCESLTSLDVSNFNTSKVTNMEYMFYNCGNLKTIYVGDGWNTSKVTKSDYMFQYSSNLVGGRGTRYDSYKINRTYAHIDGGPSNPGYFTRK